MNENFVVITEIYCGVNKLSRIRQEKKELEIWERNHLIVTMFNEKLTKNNQGLMAIYSEISVELKEHFGILISEDQIMRVLKAARSRS